jgi:hypothetical protein
MQISTTIMESSMEITQKAKDRTAIWSSDTASGHLSRGTWDSIQYRHLYTDVHHSTIHNTQAMEATQMPYNWWMDQENVVYMHNEVLLSHKE